ncbi:hypothetical protein Nepgr_026630 [Nepenthes gracilis]|uniref:Uncharacterized protein n=1 Tax=Nepenthes gracilis TaxID=150966 RepID=A0AAD3T8K5_NEPGR|nr:hypothetical protein Nepgr_026630 [Nepenthes gracilis]
MTKSAAHRARHLNAYQNQQKPAARDKWHQQLSTIQECFRESRTTKRGLPVLQKITATAAIPTQTQHHSAARTSSATSAITSINRRQVSSSSLQSKAPSPEATLHSNFRNNKQPNSNSKP